jgi:signal transduction histidine kinase
MPRFEVSQNLRIVFFGVLLLASAQVFWWIWDQAQHSREEQQRMTAVYEADQFAATELLASGHDGVLIERTFPHLVVDDGQVAIDPQALATLEERRSSRINQYGWEGGFFLVVLLCMMWLLSRTIAAEATLRRRQQDFVAAVSHELKSPIASLQLAAETMAQRPLDEEARQRHLQRILADIARLGTMVSNILDTTKLARGDIELNPEPIALGRWVDNEMRNLRERAAAGAVRVDREIDEGLEVLADPSAVRIVVRNLLENALHATAAAGGGTVTVTARADARSVLMTVRDDGIGFPPEHRKRIFESFFRVGAEMNRKTPGSGLGLAIVRRYLELDGGRIEAHSEGAGTGATFTVRWRQAPGAQP